MAGAALTDRGAVRLPDDLLIFPIQSLLSWCPILPLNWEIGKRKKKKEKGGISLVVFDIF